MSIRTEELLAFTSASGLPYKLIKHPDFQKNIVKNRIGLIHCQLAPTNQCNMDCSFCACKDRNRNDYWKEEDIYNIVNILKENETKAVTITGAGEPLLNPYINLLFSLLINANIEIGLVTNGFNFDKLEDENIKRMLWCRISASDDYCNIDYIQPYIKKYPQVDWAYSYVVLEKTNWENLKKHIQFALDNNFTHIRLIPHLLKVDNIDMSSITNFIINHFGLIPKIIIQNRTVFTKGINPCYMSLFKNFINADGYVFGCCGLMYSNPGSPLDNNREMALCHYSELTNYIKEQKFFDGSKCQVCYYGSYNHLVHNLMKINKHLNHI